MEHTGPAAPLPAGIRKLQARFPDLTVAIRGRLSGRGGRGRWFLTTPAALATDGARLVVARRYIVCVDDVDVLEILSPTA